MKAVLFVVVREIDDLRSEPTRDWRVFDEYHDAKEYYDAAEHVCWNGPSDNGNINRPIVVTNCWLYKADTTDIKAAAALALEERATLLAVCFAPEDS